jgi:ABC-type polysaccharide/polyol phosphate transport system ATPase subunit
MGLLRKRFDGAAGAAPIGTFRRLSATKTHTPEERARALADAPASVVVDRVSKAFRLPHQHYSTLKERALHPFSSSSYDVLQALQEVSFSVQTGEFFGVVGRNGSGKSTLLKCLAGIYAVDGGDIEIDGRVSPFIELGVGFNPDLTARDNVVINAIMLGLTRKEARRRFDEIIAFAELEDFVDLKLKNYSSGMSVRLGFSVAVQADADLLLVDEVLAVGDASFQQKCFDKFEQLRAEGRTLMLVTHDMGTVERFCDRAMLLEQGELIEIGDPGHVARRYNEVNFGYTGGTDPEADARSASGARIMAVWCEASGGERSSSFRQGTRCSVHMEVEFQETAEHPHFFLFFRNEVRHTVFVATTVTHGYTGTYEAGERVTIVFSFENLLAPNRYTITPRVAMFDPDERVLDAKADLIPFVSDGEIYTAGVVDLPTEFEVVRE